MPKPPSDPATHSKPCTLCHKPRDVLVRCQIDESGTWHFVCPGACWKSVSGGVIDGDLAQGHERYRYGGMWKNKHAGVSAKVPKRLKGKMVRGKAGGVGEKGGEGSGGEGGGGGGEEGGGSGEEVDGVSGVKQIAEQTT